MVPVPPDHANRVTPILQLSAKFSGRFGRRRATTPGCDRNEMERRKSRPCHSKPPRSQTQGALPLASSFDMSRDWSIAVS